MSLTISKCCKVELNPNNRQITLLKKHTDATRFAYNYAISRVKESRINGLKTPTSLDLQHEIVSLKKTNPWMTEVSKCAFETGIDNASKAFENFFKRLSLNKKKLGYPRYKSKFVTKPSTRFRGAIHTNYNCIKLPRIGKIRIKNKGYLPLDSLNQISLKGIVVNLISGKWFAFVRYSEEISDILPREENIVGIDLGIKTLSVCSNGEIYENPKALRKSLIKLKRLQRSASRKKKGSNNRRKANQKVAKLHYRISCIRRDCLHKTTSSILAITKPSTIVIEDLNVSGMLKNRKLSRAVSDVGFGMFRSFLEYKCKWHGVNLVVASRWFPSTKTCSQCGWVWEDITLGDRRFRCKSCGLEIDRDLNAAINLKKYGELLRNLNVSGQNVSLSSESDSG